MNTHLAVGARINKRLVVTYRKRDQIAPAIKLLIDGVIVLFVFVFLGNGCSICLFLFEEHATVLFSVYGNVTSGLLQDYDWKMTARLLLSLSLTVSSNK
jgi:hypothetical protein